MFPHQHVKSNFRTIAVMMMQNYTLCHPTLLFGHLIFYSLLALFLLLVLYLLIFIYGVNLRSRCIPPPNLSKCVKQCGFILLAIFIGDDFIMPIADKTHFAIIGPIYILHPERKWL